MGDVRRCRRPGDGSPASPGCPGTDGHRQPARGVLEPRVPTVRSPPRRTLSAQRRQGATPGAWSHWRRSDTHSSGSLPCPSWRTGFAASPASVCSARTSGAGDEQRILEAIEFPDDEYELHSLLMDVIEVLEANPDADCSRLGIIVYASTPCERCRSRSVRLLHRHQVAPGWLTEECRFDSSEETRELVRELAKPPQTESG